MLRNKNSKARIACLVIFLIAVSLLVFFSLNVEAKKKIKTGKDLTISINQVPTQSFVSSGEIFEGSLSDVNPAPIQFFPIIFEGSGAQASSSNAAPTSIFVFKPEEENRLIVLTVSREYRENFKKLRCKIIHELRDATAISCPAEIKKQDVLQQIKSQNPLTTLSADDIFEDEILFVQDINSICWINAQYVWQLGYNGSGITVAVLDTGIDTDHPELVDSIAGGMGFGYTGYEDDSGHGTGVSGIIIGKGLGANDSNIYCQNISDGTSAAKGVSPDAKIWMGKVCNTNGGCFESDIAAAIEYVVNNNISKILSISLGGGYTPAENCDYDWLAQKVNWAVDSGVSAIVAAGNDGASGVSIPGCASKAIGVGATDGNVRGSFSGTGLALDIMAPGVKINSSSINGRYGWASGTSAAAPHVAAVVALLRQANPSITDSQIKNALYTTAKDLGDAGFDIYYGWGRVDALAAVNYTLNLPPIACYRDSDCGSNGCMNGTYTQYSCLNPGTENSSCISQQIITDNDVDGYDTQCDGDCNDSSSSIYPNAPELCDKKDNNCNGVIDEGCPLTCLVNGTEYNPGTCLFDKPKFCDNGTIIDKCSQCACPSTSSGNKFTCNSTKYSSCVYSLFCSASKCPAGYTFKGCISSGCSTNYKKAKCEKIYQTNCSSSPSCGTDTKINQTSCGSQQLECQADGSCKLACSCSSWVSGTCGTGGCSSTQRQYTRTCSPTGCNTTSKCVDEVSCSSTNKIFTCKNTYTSSCSYPCSSSRCPSGYTFTGCSRTGCSFIYQKATCTKTYNTSCLASPSCGSDAKLSERSC